MEAESILRIASNCAGTPLADAAAALRWLSAAPDGEPFALSTLRGQFADNRAWSHDPVRPAIIVGTVDMIGSRLLFSGYGGLGRYGRSQHAALLGQDALVVLDEAQLAPAFLKTLLAIERRVRPGASALGRPFAFMSLTATQPPSETAAPAPEPARRPLTLEPEDLLLEPTVRQRVEARKTLRLAPPDGSFTGKADDVLAQCMAKEAFDLAAGTNAAVVVFVNTVTALDKIHAALHTTHGIPEEHCLRFNGQMRGHERDEVFADQSTAPANRVFQAFRQRRPRAGRGHPVFLLATSAGEVGVNFDADHAVCDLVTLERTAQRLGRVNRAGDGDAKITVFFPADPSKLDDQPLQKTAELLARLPLVPDADGAPTPGQHSASPAALRTILDHPEAPLAFTPTSDPPPLDSARLDDWSLTSLPPDEFPRPQVSYWLRGITPDDEQAMTQLVWREELRYARDGEDAADMLKTRPAFPREIVQVPTYRAVKWLLARAKKHLGVRKQKADPYHGEYAAVLTPSGDWEPWQLTDFEEKDTFERKIIGATIILPTTFGGLPKDGLIDETYEEKARDVLEVATDAAKGYCRVLLHELPDDRWSAFELSSDPASQEIGTSGSYSELIGKLAKKFHQLQPDQSYRLLARKREPDAPIEGDENGSITPVGYRVEYFASTRTEVNTADDADAPSLREKEVPLSVHLEETERYADRITSRLNLPPPIREAIVLAARWHDLGKDREHWQRAVGNLDLDNPLAKSASPYFNRQETQGYRHEFGSLMDVLYLKKDELRNHPESDLVLHLIAAHHGHGRPGFEEKAYDAPKYLHRQCVEAAAEAELRFDRLQRRFGWWGLAYLEALVKCADGMASDRAANPPEPSSVRSTCTLAGQAELFSRP